MLYSFYYLKNYNKKGGKIKLPRQARRKSHSNIYHCMLRGVNKQDIFFEDKDYLEFQDIIRKNKKKFLYQVYSYVLMPNHIHLEIKDENCKLSQIIHSIGTSYANYFNKKYKRVGHLFENRFKSRNVENVYYILNLARYIHQNPLKAKISTMEEYRWSSYPEYFQKNNFEEENKIVDTDKLLEIFSPEDKNNTEEFLKFNIKGVDFQESTELLEYEMKNKLTDEEVIYFIKKELEIDNIQEIQRYHKTYRNDIIQKIRKIRGVTQQQTARVLGINIRTVQRAYREKKELY